MEENKKEKEQLEEIDVGEKESKPIYNIPWKGLIFIGVIIVLMIICVIVIMLNGGFYQW
ncbi:MAG: hypothetical protein SO176_02980 [Bacilli bacterium]|nr:hypothetical protein [Bacilli bacterium]